jgi:hypothetical protein
MKKIATIALVLLIFLNCRNGTKTPVISKENNQDTLLMQWKNDSLGCIGLRTAEKARLLFKQYNLQKKNREAIIEVLGKPNKISDNGSQLSLVYYFDTKCNNGKIIDSIEHCSASFFYIDKKKQDCSLSTACQ